MKVALGNTALAATLITNCIVAVAHDGGIDLSAAVQDQINTEVTTAIGLAAVAFVQWAHDEMKKHFSKKIAALSATPVSAVQPAK